MLVLGISGTVMAQEQVQGQSFDFFQNFGQERVISPEQYQRILESAETYNNKHGVEFYTITIPSQDSESFDEVVEQIINSWSEEELANKVVNLFLYSESEQEYIVYVDQTLQSKLSYYMIDNILSNNFEQANNVDSAIGNTVPRLIDYFILATEATVGSEQFSIKADQARENPRIRVYEKMNYLSFEEETTVEEPQPIEEPVKVNGGLPWGIIVFVVIGLLLVSIGVIFFIRQRNEEEYYEEYEIEEVEDEEYYPE